MSKMNLISSTLCFFVFQLYQSLWHKMFCVSTLWPFLYIGTWFLHGFISKTMPESIRISLTHLIPPFTFQIGILGESFERAATSSSQFKRFVFFCVCFCWDFPMKVRFEGLKHHLKPRPLNHGVFNFFFRDLQGNFIAFSVWCLDFCGASMFVRSNWFIQVPTQSFGGAYCYGYTIFLRIPIAIMSSSV